MVLTPYQEDVVNAKICPYCKSITAPKTEEEIYGKAYRGRMIIACINFPECDSYVGTHEDGTALGRLANKKLRKAKADAHYWFDKIWKEGHKDRSELYGELSEYLGLPGEYTHIGMFSNKTCETVRQWANDYYNSIVNNK